MTPPRPTPPPPQPPRPPGPGRTYSPVDRLTRPTVATTLVLGVSLLCTPAMYYAELVAVTVALAAVGLFLAVSLLTTRAAALAGAVPVMTTISPPVDSAPAGETAASSRPGPTTAAAVLTPAVDGVATRPASYVTAAPAPRPVPYPGAGWGVTP